MMDENIPEPDDFAPGDLKISPLRFFRDAPCGLPKDLEMMDNPYLHKLVPEKILFSP